MLVVLSNVAHFESELTALCIFGGGCSQNLHDIQSVAALSLLNFQQVDVGVTSMRHELDMEGLSIPVSVMHVRIMHDARVQITGRDMT